MRTCEVCAGVVDTDAPEAVRYVGRGGRELHFHAQCAVRFGEFLIADAQKCLEIAAGQFGSTSCRILEDAFFGFERDASN